MFDTARVMHQNSLRNWDIYTLASDRVGVWNEEFADAIPLDALPSLAEDETGQDLGRCGESVPCTNGRRRPAMWSGYRGTRA